MARIKMIPSGDGEFLEWGDVFCAYLGTTADEWGIPEAAVAALEGFRTEYRRAYTAAQNPNRGKADVFAKNEARAAYEADVRRFIQEYIAFSHLVSDDDRILLGVTVRSASRTPVPVPSTIPSFTIGTAVLQHLSIIFHDENGAGEAKPFGVHGAEILWEIRETPTENQEDLTHSAFSTRSPYKLAFTGDQRGSRVYVCLRWENTRGEKGPWSAISSAVVP